MLAKIGATTAVFLASTGCISFEQTLLLRENGSGTYAFLLSVDKKLIDLAAAMGEGGEKKDPFGDIAPMEGPTKAERKAMKAAGLTFDRFEAGEIDGGYGVDLAVGYARPSALSAMSNNAPDGPTLVLRQTDQPRTYDLVFTTVDLAGSAGAVDDNLSKLDADLQRNLEAVEGAPAQGATAEVPATDAAAAAGGDANPFANADIGAMLKMMGISAPTIGMTIEVPGQVLSLTPADPSATLEGNKVRISTSIPVDGAANAGQAFDQGKPAMKTWTVRFVLPEGRALPEALLTP
jgi:hypothetical protein